MPMNLKEIREILELLKGFDVREFELGRGDTVLKLRRGPANGPVVLPPVPAAAEAPARLASVPPATASVPPKPTYKEIVSPIVGTFYRSPAPDAAP
ncbi:MAG TPA: hypothetical protein VHM68_01930, partial [Candidatus Deferrimicrobium sp.]|nr:hypothetical protein [Candidatus Deferrimicrobium sp.]